MYDESQIIREFAIENFVRTYCGALCKTFQSFVNIDNKMIGINLKLYTEVTIYLLQTYI